MGGEHDFKESYYGWKCSKCGDFVPYGCEYWVDPDDVIDEDDYFDDDNPYDLEDIYGTHILDTPRG